jgi:excinuclease ABC subunit C
MRFLSGDTAAVVARLEAEMEEASAHLEFERAARIRDRLAAVHKAAETQQMVAERAEDLDVIGIAEDDLEAAVQVFHVRKGKVVGRNGFVADKVEDLTPEQFMSRVLQQLYGAPAIDLPRRILVPRPPDDQAVLSAWLSDNRGGPVAIAVPQRGAKRALQEMVTRNAAEDLARHRLRRTSDHNARAKALTDLQAELGLRQAPLRIECYDMSHLQGTDYVGSMVVVEDGLAKKADYRRFIVRSVPGNDDYAAMEEVLTRRLQALVDERAAKAAPAAATDPDEVPGARRRPRRFAYPPQLLLVDGGRGQLGVAERVVAAFGLDGEIDVAALAKQFEEVYRPGRPEPVRLARGAPALYLLQQIRDEAHRFAISFHRERRTKRMTTSALHGIPGLGPARTARLLREMGGITKLRAADVDELNALGWLPSPVAAAVYAHLHGGISGVSSTPAAMGETGGR